MLRDRSNKYIKTNEVITDIGIDKPTKSDALTLRNIIITTAIAIILP
jgi:hypothetical protein